MEGGIGREQTYESVVGERVDSRRGVVGRQGVVGPDADRDGLVAGEGLRGFRSDGEGFCYREGWHYSGGSGQQATES